MESMLPTHPSDRDQDQLDPSLPVSVVVQDLHSMHSAEKTFTKWCTPCGFHPGNLRRFIQIRKSYGVKNLAHEVEIVDLFEVWIIPE